MSKIFKETFVIRIIHDTKRLGVQLSKNAEIKSVSFRLQHYWMNFAKYDDPTPTTQNASVPARLSGLVIRKTLNLGYWCPNMKKLYLNN